MSTRKRIARVLITTDKHVRDVDFKTLRGFKAALRQNIIDQIEYCENNEVTHVMDTGDIADKGFRDLGEAYSWENLWRRWKATSEIYSCIGNHLFLEMDSNPELFWIQPNPYIKPKDANYVMPDEPLIKVVPSVTIGTVMFSFHHFNKHDKNYYCTRPEHITYHHAIYHDDVIIPKNVQEAHHIYHKNITSDYLQGIFSNVDSATVGHIHKNIGLVYMHLKDNRTVPMDIPGSCAPTNSSDDTFFPEISLPQYDIFDDGTVLKTYVKFSRHLTKITRYRKQDKEIPKEIKIMQEEVRDMSFLNNQASEILAHSSSSKLTVPQYLKSIGYTDVGVKLALQAMQGALTSKSAVETLFTINNDKDDLL